MASRYYSVYPDGPRKFRIKLITVHAKRRKQIPTVYRGYTSRNSAANDVKRLKAHFRAGGAIANFVQHKDNHSNCRLTQEEKDFLALRRKEKGIMRIRNKKKEKIKSNEYKSYVKLLTARGATPMTRNEWDLLPVSGTDRDKLIRRYSRNPCLLHQSILRGLDSSTPAAVDSSIASSMQYFANRLVTINAISISCKASLKTLRSAIFSGKAYTLLMKASFDDDPPDDGVIDLSDDDFTSTNVSVAQLARVILQACTVEKVYSYMVAKLNKEKSLIDQILSVVMPTKASIEKHWESIKQFKKDNSMHVLSVRAHVETDEKVSAKTILKWYNEFQEYSLFKEDLRGCYQRKFFLQEFGLKRPFELYLQAERHLTVATARANLEVIIGNYIAKNPGSQIEMNNILPLHNRTVHRWMLACGCKYEKASVSYYTDSHEALETKRDFNERYDNYLNIIISMNEKHFAG